MFRRPNEARIKNLELHRLRRKVNLLSDEERNALLESLVKRSGMSRLLAE